jgi:hypothetical protein
VRRYIHLEKLFPPGIPSPGNVFLSLALPGYAFFILGRRLLGCLVLPAYLIAAMVYVVALGFPAASIGYGLLISLHAISMVYLEGAWFKDSEFRLRFLLAFGTLFAVWGLIYAPLMGFVERHWFMPLRMNERVLIVHSGVAPESIKRGDWLAYEIPHTSLGGHGDNVVLHAGLDVAPVLALPGDRLRFTSKEFFVNGQAFPLAPHMPSGGEWVMPEKTWFVWPNLAIGGHGGVTEGTISATMQQVAMVTQERMIGRPFKRWFGRHQWP